MRVLLLFFLSGATALIYEVIWSNYLKLMMGSTVQAQTVVLAVFMGGLALGNRLFGKRADALEEPLKWYGYVEIAIGVYAFLFGVLHHLADAVFLRVGPALLEHSTAFLVFKACLSVTLLAPPTILMGGTLPLVAAWLQKTTPDARRFSARFYSVNSLGAVVGAGLAGFFLVSWFGLSATLQLAGLTNLLVGAAALALSGAAPCPTPAAAAPPPAGENSAPAPPAPENESGRAADIRLAVALVALTGGVSMGLEILAARSLILIFGGSLQAFSIVLMSFILGIGIGASVIASPRVSQWPRAATTFALLLIGATLIALYIMNIENWVQAYRWIKSGLAASPVGYFYHLLLNSLISMAVLGLPAGVLGAVLPLWIRENNGGKSNLGREVGRLLTWNTLGAVIGVLLTGFVLMPTIGLRGSFGLLAYILLAAAWRVGRLRWKPVTAAAPPAALAGALTLILLTGGQTWKSVISAGVFRFRETDVNTERLDDRRNQVDLLFYQDGTDATVSVERGAVADGALTTVLRINGKPDASSYGDMGTQYLLGHLPMLARPAAKDVFVLGFGSGVTAGALLGHPVDRIDIAENCGPVLEAAPLFAEWNKGVHTNTLARIWTEDARAILKLNARQYDVIISEPSNPWTIGVGSVFSRDFYEIAANRLKPGGVMAQWFHIYEMHDGILDLVLNTFGSVFPHFEIWDPGHGDIIILGSLQPWSLGQAEFQAFQQRPAPMADLAAIGLSRPEMIMARQLASQATAPAIIEGGMIQSDAFPTLEYAAPMAFFLGRNSELLFLFDERTWQSRLAPPEKRRQLSKVSDRDMKSIFGRHRSVNPEVFDYAERRAARNGARQPLEFYNGSHPVPVIFWNSAESSRLDRLPPDASDDFKRLLAAEAALIQSPETWEPSVAQIERTLKIAAQAPPTPLDWTPTHYAAVAARACISEGRWDRAQALLELGRSFSDVRELRYLQRVIERLAPSSQGN